MILPTQQAHGIAASNLLQSVLDTMDRRQQEEDDKRLQRPKEDEVLAAKTNSRDVNRKAQEKIASTMFDVQHQDPNRIKIDLAERLGRKLGLDVDALKASSSLGAALEGAIKDLDYASRQKLEKELGLDKLKLTLQDLVQAIKLPEPKADGTGNESGKTSGDPFLDELKAKQRLEDIAKPKTAVEKKAAAQDPQAGRVVDEETKAEDKQDLKAAEALTKLEDVTKTQEVLKKVYDHAVSGKSEGSAGEETGMLLVTGAAADLAKSDLADASTDNAGNTGFDDAASGNLTSSAAAKKVKEHEEAHEKPELPRFNIRVDEIGLYTYLTHEAA